MDDNAANNTLTAEVGPDGTWHAVSGGGSRNTSNDSVAADNFRGRALDTQDGTAFGKLAVGSGTVHDNDFLVKGSILIKITPQFNYDDGSNQRIITLSFDGSNYMVFEYLQSSDILAMSCNWNGTNDTIYYPAFTEDYSLQRQMVILLFWDADKDIFGLALDGQMASFDTKAETPTTSHPVYFYLGSDESATVPGDIIIDEIKTFSECLLPYGAYFIGNGEVDTSVAHSDIQVFLEGDETNSDSLPIGSGTITISGATQGTGVDDAANSAFEVDANAEYVYFPAYDTYNFNESAGLIAFWYKETTGPSAWGRFFEQYFAGQSGEHFGLMRGNLDTTIAFRHDYSGSSPTTYYNFTSVTNVFDGVWHWIAIRWDQPNSYRELLIDGISQEIVTSAFTVEDMSNSGGIMYIGSRQAADQNIGGLIDKFFVTNNPYTPEIPTAFGKPLHLPLTLLG
jgi:hypothetical protein